MGKLIKVIKASGEVEPFSEEKIISSLMRAGADKEAALSIVQEIKPRLYQHIPTFQIYSTVMKLLRRKERELANRYSLKRAIMELGPTGYPFEQFMAAVLRRTGYRAETNKIIQGKCISHEVDIMAVHRQKKYMIECKFHNQVGFKTDVKEALYTYARFLDIKHQGFDIPWLITNTKVTQEVKLYADCIGMQITAWDYPEGDGLRRLIDDSGLHPVTSLTNLSLKQKRDLIEKGIVFCKDLVCSS